MTRSGSYRSWRERAAVDERTDALLRAVFAVVPGLARWIAGLIEGRDVDPEFTRRVRDILPARSASEAAADDLRAERGED